MNRPKLSSEELRELETLGMLCRGDILKMTTVAQSGHPGGSMSSIDIYLTVYKFANIDPQNPFSPERDRVVISHGHTSPGVYSALGRLGFFDIEEVIAGFRHPGSIFEGHITRGIPGVEWTTGNLGQGLSAGVGMALAAKLSKRDYHVFTLMSDAEQAKGQVAEARRTAAKYKLDNLTVVIDYNDAQISGRASDTMPVNIKGDYEADGWKVMEVNGHDYAELSAALYQAVQEDVPVAIIAHTIMGKGVSFMEDDVSFHGKPLDLESCRRALAELGVNDDLEFFIERRKKMPITREKLIPFFEEKAINIGEPKFYLPHEKTDNRSAFGKALADLAKLNKGISPIAVIDCDLKPSTKTAEFEKIWPENFIQIGVQEHNAATLAGSMSVSGVLTFFTDFGVFGIDETYNQQRLNDINKTNLKVVVTHVGLDVGEDGKTHHCLDYIGALKNFYGFKLIVPADPNQTDRAVRYAANEKGNFVIALGRSKINPISGPDGKPFFGEGYEFEYGKVDIIRTGKDATIVATGQMVSEAVKAADMLKSEGIEITVLGVSCPLHASFEHVKDFLMGKVLTVEDHNVKSGLAAILAEYFTSEGFLPEKFVKVGVSDYSVSGSKDFLYRLAGLDAESIAKRVREF
ncbi:transketolase [Kosmotoga arenicorallina S304]|uniref:Transketolase n=1 Tax=Kosmotoga arenicorallina S304 TaxID=1453497 RepID=A0A176K1T5_9BACT|nr:transketolase [Kosmotoga arenicorallina]OAA30959.1 transketolase [Kosmotoga arenicorallina S304]